MSTDKSIVGIIRHMERHLEAEPMEMPKPVDATIRPMNRADPSATKPGDPVRLEAREIVATIFDGENTATSRRCAQIAREGGYDGDTEMQIAEAALRRGVVIGREDWK